MWHEAGDCALAFDNASAVVHFEWFASYVADSEGAHTSATFFRSGQRSLQCTNTTERVDSQKYESQGVATVHILLLDYRYSNLNVAHSVQASVPSKMCVSEDVHVGTEPSNPFTEWPRADGFHHCIRRLNRLNRMARRWLRRVKGALAAFDSCLRAQSG